MFDVSAIMRCPFGRIFNTPGRGKTDISVGHVFGTRNQANGLPENMSDIF